jgi:hypothetical protein
MGVLPMVGGGGICVEEVLRWLSTSASSSIIGALVWSPCFRSLAAPLREQDQGSQHQAKVGISSGGLVAFPCYGLPGLNPLPRGRRRFGLHQGLTGPGKGATRPSEPARIDVNLPQAKSVA